MPQSVNRAVAAVLLAVTLVVGGALPAVTQDPTSEALAPPSLATAASGLSAIAFERVADPTAVETATLQPAGVKLPRCEIEDVRTRYQKVKHWRRTLLDTRLKLRRAYRPWDIVSVSRAGIAGRGQVRKIVIKDLRALADAARKAGKPLAVRSSYRSYDYQKALFASYVSTYGYDHALRFSARAGHSEHQLGTTIDFSVGPGVPLSTTFGESPSGKWLARNGWKYGFIMSYPKGKRSVSCYSYEPWHWRYVGPALAKRIHDSGQVPRRYLYTHFETAP